MIKKEKVLRLQTMNHKLGPQVNASRDSSVDRVIVTSQDVINRFPEERREERNDFKPDNDRAYTRDSLAVRYLKEK